MVPGTKSSCSAVDTGGVGEALLDEPGNLGTVDGLMLEQRFSNELEALRVLANDLGGAGFLVGQDSTDFFVDAGTMA